MKMKEWFNGFKNRLMNYIAEITFTHVVFVIVMSTLMGINVYHYYQADLVSKMGIVFTIWMIGTSLLIIGLCITTIFMVIMVLTLTEKVAVLQEKVDDQGELMIDVSRAQDNNQNIVISKLNEVEKIILEQHDNTNTYDNLGE